MAMTTNPLPEETSPMEKFQPGEIITAHIPNLAVRRVQLDSHSRSGVGWVEATYATDKVLVELALPVDGSIRYERVTPADGEPQPGELWADQADNLYLARKDHPAGVRLVNVDKPGSIPAESWESVHGGPLGPIYRVAQRPVLSQIEAGEAAS